MVKKVLLINDTTNWYHFGCTATSTALRSRIQKAGGILQTVSITETYKIGSVPNTADGFLSERNFRSFCEANRDLVEQIRSNDILMINGEGTLHGLRQAPLSLLYTAFISKVFLKKNVEIVNHSVYPQDDLSLDKAEIIDVYKLVYSTIDFVAIREPESLELMRSLGLSVTQSFDCMPIYIEENYVPHHQKDQKTLLIAGSAAWLHLNILSDEQGNIEEFERGLAGFIQYINIMLRRGYEVQFLYGAAEYPAKDDREFIAFVRSRLESPLNVIEAKSLDSWLGYIEKATLLVSGRFHHTIAAACLNTNFIILNSNTPKIVGLSKVLGCGSVIDYHDPRIAELLLQKTFSIEQGILPKCPVTRLSNMAEKNFLGLKETQTGWYTEDKIRELLENYMQTDEHLIIAQTQFEHTDVLISNLHAAIGAAIKGQTAVMPINLHNNHWVGAIIQMHANGEIQVIYVDPMGDSFEQEENAAVFIDTIQSLTAEINPTHPVAHITVLHVQQQPLGNFDDCGPFTVSNLINLATNNLEGLSPEEITNLLYIPDNGKADFLRILYEEMLARQEIQSAQEMNITASLQYAVDNGILGETSLPCHETELTLLPSKL